MAQQHVELQELLGWLGTQKVDLSILKIAGCGEVGYNSRAVTANYSVDTVIVHTLVRNPGS